MKKYRENENDKVVPPSLEWTKPYLFKLSITNTYDTPENCAPAKFGGTGDSLGPSGIDCGPPLS